MYLDSEGHEFDFQHYRGKNGGPGPLSPATQLVLVEATHFLGAHLCESVFPTGRQHDQPLASHF